MSLSNNEKIILIFLSVLVLGLLALGVGLAYFNYFQHSVIDNKVNSSGIVIMPATETKSLQQTPTPVLTQTSLATPTPDMLITRFVITTPTQQVVPSLTPFKVIIYNTAVPNPPQQYIPQQSSQQQQNSNQQNTNNCAAQLSYAKSTHQYNLARIDQIYRPLIDFYQSMLEEAIRDRDALGVVEYQRKLDAQNRQLNAAIKAENQRYQGEVANINSTCR